jgi:hypothetical protein
VTSKKRGWIMTACLILAGAELAAGLDDARKAQEKRMTELTAGLAAGQAPAGAGRTAIARARLLEEAVPELHAFQERLGAIEAKIVKIIASLGQKKIGREAAKEKLLPLIKEQQEIQNDPEFLVEQRLAQAYFSSQEYRNGVLKIMRGAAEN